MNKKPLPNYPANTHGLSKIDFEWLLKDDYDHDDSLSATTLLKPTRELVAIKNCSDKLTSDISDKIWAVVGTACHASRERVKYPGLQSEKRYYTTINNVKISGKFDALDHANNFPCLENKRVCQTDLVINDLKTTTLWNVARGEFDDWINQLSIYRLILHHNKIRTSEWAVISALVRDWTDRAAKLKGIAGCQLQNIPIQLMDLTETHEMISHKINLIIPYLDCRDINTIPLCSEEERQKYNSKICLKYCQARQICDYGQSLWTDALAEKEGV